MASPRTAKRSAPAASAAQRPLDTSALEGLLGYHARRAALTVIGDFLLRMQRDGIRPVEFSVLQLVASNPGCTSRELCAALNILPPNFVRLAERLHHEGWLKKQAHATDRRAIGLVLTATGARLVLRVAKQARESDAALTGALDPAEREQLVWLLKRVYAPESAAE